jgi:TubC N-terminal docking domain
MTLAELLAELEARQIRIEGAGGRLRLTAPPGALAPWLQAALVERRAALLALPEPEGGAAEPEPEGGAAEPAPAAIRATGAGDVPASPPLPISASRTPQVVRGASLPVGPEGTLRIPLDDLVYGDFLERNKLRIVGGAAYPDGRTFRPTIFLADDVR